jgi:hypothetical protein
MFDGWKFDGSNRWVAQMQRGPNAVDLSSRQRLLLRQVAEGWQQRLLRTGDALDCLSLWRGLRFLYDVGGLPPPRRMHMAAGPREAQSMADRIKARGGRSCNGPVLSRVLQELRRGSRQWEAYHMSGSGLDRMRRVLSQMREVVAAGPPLDKDLFSGLGVVSCHWMAYCEFLHRADLMRHRDVATLLGFVDGGAWDCCLFEDDAVVLRAPQRLVLDELERLSGVRPPALAWADGTVGYFVSGIALEPWVVEEPERLTAATALQQRNAEVRRVMIELMGPQRFLSQAQPRVVDTDRDGAGMARRLLRVDMRGDEPYSMVEVNCPSTGHVHYLRVPPQLQTCREAVAWTFGCEPDDYAPLVQA